MADDAPTQPNPMLKLALELGPLLLFFFTFSRFGIYVATAVFMVAITVSLLVTRVREKRWPPMPLISAVLVLVLGGLTIYLQDETFIKIKVTAVNALFGLTLAVGLMAGRNFLTYLMGEAIQLTQAGWNAMTKMWIGYFFTLAAINEMVWRNTSTETWVKFKTFGLLGLTFVFVMAQAPIIAKHQLTEEPAEAE